MNKHDDYIAKELYGVVGEMLEERLKEFFGSKFEITQSSDKLELRKKERELRTLTFLTRKFMLLIKNMKAI